MKLTTTIVLENADDHDSNLPFCAIGLIIIPFILKYERDPSTMNHKLANVDWIGSFTFIAGLTSFLVGISWGGSMFPWSHAATLVPIILGLAVVFTTGLYEKYLAKVNFLRPLRLRVSWAPIWGPHRHTCPMPLREDQSLQPTPTRKVSTCPAVIPPLLAS